MKNNIRYKGTNNTSAIIFLKSQKLPAMLLCLREPPVWFLWCCSFLIFIFVVVSSFVDLFFILLLLFIHIFFSTSSLTLPWTIAGFLHSFYTFSPAHRTVIRDTFIFQPFCYLLTTSATVLSGHFLPTGVFYLTLLPDIFGTTCFYQGLPGSQQFFLEVCRASYWSSKHRPSPSTFLIHSNPQNSYLEQFSFKFYHILAWITCGSSLIYLLLPRFKLFSLVQSICKGY